MLLGTSNWNNRQFFGFQCLLIFFPGVFKNKVCHRVTPFVYIVFVQLGKHSLLNDYIVDLKKMLFYH